MSEQSQIGVTGLAVMGSNIARNFANHGYTVALHNRSVAKTDALLSEHGSEGKFVRSETIPEFLDALVRQKSMLFRRSATVIHTRSASLQTAFAGPNALISGLAAEGWTRLIGEEFS